MQSVLRFIKESYPLLFLIALIASCQQEQNTSFQQTRINHFTDPVFIEIADFQDRRDTDSILAYFNHDNAAYRQAAAEALGSVQDSAALPRLSFLLSDENSKVRKAAAYAIGQLYDSAAVAPLAKAYENEDSVFVKRELLESLGKSITAEQLTALQNMKTEHPLENEGMAWALYHSGLRNIHDGISLDMALELLDSTNNYETRLGAANFLMRVNRADFSQIGEQLTKLVVLEPAADVRMAMAASLRNYEQGKNTLVALLNDEDYRVRINALRGLGSLTIDTEQIEPLLQDENVNVVLLAASLLSSKSDNSEQLMSWAGAVQNSRAKAALWAKAIVTAEDPAVISDTIKQVYQNATSPYVKADYLSPLSQHIPNFDFIVTETFNAEHAVIKTTGISSLINMMNKEGFDTELMLPMANVLKDAILTADIGMVYHASAVLMDSTKAVNDYIGDYTFLDEAKAKLSLPKDIEALQRLNAVIAIVEGREPPETTNDFNHPIDWEYVKTIPEDLEVVVDTEKGPITLRMLVNEAPGSVANFLQLAESGYYNGKNFHRVVPNFVIQGGCNRGDGFGGEDYSIRSELANRAYRTGSVGMASAGKDTEGTQWFITHSPTPHLDGKYTIFAEVTDGMDIVHNIEVSDKILSISKVISGE